MTCNNKATGKKKKKRYDSESAVVLKINKYFSPTLSHVGRECGPGPVREVNDKN